MLLNVPKMQKWMRLGWSAVGLGLVGWFVVDFFGKDFAGRRVDDVLGETLGPIGSWLADKVFFQVAIGGVNVEVIVLWMLLPMIFLTFYYGFVNFRGFIPSLNVLRGKFEDKSAPGEVSQVQALTTALSGTVGLGNIAGVAIAIALGGPGATFWMFVISIAAMAVKFSECTLAVKYREVHADGTVSGGPMYYLRHGLKNRGFARLGIILAVAYAVLTLPSILQVVQVNQAHSMFRAATGINEGLWFGVVIAVLTGVVIIGGIKQIAKVTVRLVPLMAGIYLIAGLVVIAVNITVLPDAFLVIFKTAFSPVAVEGGIIGAIIVGMRRAVYSTEAGLGTSSIAHAAAKTREPISEGLVGLMEPFIDTLVGLVTAIIIVITGAYLFLDPVTGENLGDIQMTSAAFESVFWWFPWVLALAAFMFAFSTIISWSYYIEKVWTFLFGDTPRTVISFRIFFCVMLIPGAVMKTEHVVDFIDSVFFLLAIPNLLGIYFMAPEIRADMKDYFARLKAGKIPITKKVAKPAIAKP